MWEQLFVASHPLPDLIVDPPWGQTSPRQSLHILNNSLQTLIIRLVRCMACKRSRVRFSSSPLIENAAGIEPVAFFDGLRELVDLSLTRSDPYSDPLGQPSVVNSFSHRSSLLLKNPALERRGVVDHVLIRYFNYRRRRAATNPLSPSKARVPGAGTWGVTEIRLNS